MELPFREIAQNLNIAVGTAYGVFKTFLDTGNVSPIKHSARPESRKLTDHEELFVLGLVQENPCLYLREICKQVEDVSGTPVSGSTVCRLLRRHGLTRKKIQKVAIERCLEYRAKYMADILHYPREQLVWVDEMGSDR